MSEAPAQIQTARVRVFIDFWNYTLSMRAEDPEFQTDWAKIGHALAEAAAKEVGATPSFIYQGVNVYCSYDKSNPKDGPLRSWATNTLDRFSGVHVYLTSRQRKRSWPSCPSCHDEVKDCPACGKDMRGTEEKGIDTRIVTDMMSLAWANNYDVGVIVSADRDFVPVAEFLQTKGLKIIHGAFPPKGAYLMQKCWGSIDIPKIKTRFAR